MGWFVHDSRNSQLVVVCEGQSMDSLVYIFQGDISKKEILKSYCFKIINCERNIKIKSNLCCIELLTLPVKTFSRADTVNLDALGKMEDEQSTSRNSNYCMAFKI